MYFLLRSFHMTKRLGLLSAGWAASCAAAFYLGSSFSGSTDEDLAQQPEQEKKSRVSSRAESANASNPGERKNSARPSSTSRNIGSDVIAEVVELAKLTDPIARAQGMLALVENLEPGEYKDVVAAFRALGMTRERMGEYAILLTAWAKVDPVSALDYAKANTGTSFARETILASWVETQPEAAIVWAKENFDAIKNDRNANPWLVGIIKGMASQDLSRASQLLEELPYSEGRGEALRSVLNELIAQGPDTAKNWINGLSDEQLRDGAAARLASRLAKDDPAAALSWAGSVSEASLLRASSDIIDGWASDSPELAQAWVDSQPDAIQAAAGHGLINALAPSEAATWLTQHEGNPAFDDTIQSFAFNAIKREPELAASWIMKVTDTRKKEGIFHRVLSTWMREDTAGAMNYIENNEVPESVVRRAKRQLEEQNR
jgi:hypothetical protein